MKSTTDHNSIKKWVEDREGIPALAKGDKDTGRAGGLLRIIFPGDSTKDIDKLPWEKFFIIFDENNLEFIYSDDDEGEIHSREFHFQNKNS